MESRKLKFALHSFSYCIRFGVFAAWSIPSNACNEIIELPTPFFIAIHHGKNMTRTNGRLANDDAYVPRREPEASSKLVPFALGAIVGGVIGAAIALLYAPAEGSELRRGMTETLGGLTESAKDFIREAKSSGEKFLHDVLDPDEEEIPSTLGRMRERADDIMEDADRAIADARRRASNTGRYDEDED